MRTRSLILIALLLPAFGAGSTQVTARTIPLEPSVMQLRNVKAQRVMYKGRAALLVTDAAAANVPSGGRLVILNKTDFQDGVIEIELAGEPAANAG